MPDKVNIQRNHKDTIFHDLFSDKENALSLYNALNGHSLRRDLHPQEE